MSEPITKQPNPFVGPRAIREGEAFFGREREVDELADQLIAERVVLLYSPSGAGKSSLINAGLVPRLKSDFQVLPVLRLYHEPPAGNIRKNGVNRYLYSLLTSLEFTPEKSAEPANWSLESFPYPDDATLLIFDQFEEILTLDAMDVDAKREFFDQVGKLLRRENLWALFAMREDFIAGLDPYRLALSRGLRSTYRLDLLTKEKAQEVMVKTADTGGVTFDLQAAERLASDLSRVMVVTSGGQPEPQSGLYVEPVQLQVVCFNLWEKLVPGDTDITAQEIDVIGNVDQSLGQYYADAVHKAAEEGRVDERKVRDLFDKALITLNNVRAQVQWGDPSLEGLEKAIASLEKAHLVRRDPRRGAIWVELNHDRLINPIRSNNAAWYQEHLAPLQVRARAWEQENHPQDVLLRGKALREAEAWAQDNRAEMTPLELEFLNASQILDRQEKVQQKEREQEALKKELETEQKLRRLEQARTDILETSNKRRQWLIIGLLAFLGVTGFLLATNAYTGRLSFQLYSDLNSKQTAIANESNLVGTNEALALQSIGTANARATEVQYAQETTNAIATLNEINYRLRQSSQLALDSLALAERNPERSLLLAIESVNRAIFNQPTEPVVARAALMNALVGQKSIALSGHEEDVSTLAVSPDGRWLATGGPDRMIFLWNLAADDPGEEPSTFQDFYGSIRGLTFHPDGVRLIYISGDTNIAMVTIQDGILNSDLYFNQVAGDHINQIAVSPDGHWLAVGTESYSQDQTDFPSLWLFDISGEDFSRAMGLPGFENGVSSVAFGPDSAWLAAGDLDGTIRLWELENMQSHLQSYLEGGVAAPEAGRVLSGHEGSVSALKFSPDGRLLGSGSYDTTVRLWDMQAEDPAAEPFILRGHSDWLRFMDFSPDSRLLATGGVDNAVILWDLEAIQRNAEREVDEKSSVYQTIYFAEGITDLEFSPDLRYLAVGGETSQISVYSIPPLLKGLETKSLPELPLDSSRLSGHKGNILDLAFNPLGEALYSASADNTARIWPLATKTQGTPIVLTGHTDWVLKAAFSPDERWLATGSSDADARMWDVSSSDPISNSRILRGHEGSVYVLEVDPKGQWLATGDDDGTVRLWNIEDGKQRWILSGHEDSVSAVTFNPNGRWLASASLDGKLRIWDLDAKDPTKAVTVVDDFGVGLYSAEFNPEGDRLAVGTENGKVFLLGFASQGLSDEQSILAGHEGAIYQVKFSPDGQWLGSAGDDATVRLWRMWRKDPAAEAIVLSGHEGYISALAFSPDARWLASGGEDATIRLWDLKKTNPALSPFEMEAHTSIITALTFDPSGRWLASASADGTARLWDATTSDPSAVSIPLLGHDPWVNWVAFSPQGRWLVTASDDWTARLWHMDIQELVQLACQSAIRQLTRSEWNQYLPGEPYQPSCKK